MVGPLCCTRARAFPYAPTVHEFRRAFSTAVRQKKASKNNPGGGIPGEFVMSVQKLQRIVGTTLLENVTLGFLQGAKIGILGLNGCGKSTLMKILAGVEGEYDGIFGGEMAEGWLPCARAYFGPKPERTGQCNGVLKRKGSFETF